MEKKKIKTNPVGGGEVSAGQEKWLAILSLAIRTEMKPVMKRMYRNVFCR